MEEETLWKLHLNELQRNIKEISRAKKYFQTSFTIQKL